MTSPAYDTNYFTLVLSIIIYSLLEIKSKLYCRFIIGCHLR